MFMPYRPSLPEQEEETLWKNSSVVYEPWGLSPEPGRPLGVCAAPSGSRLSGRQLGWARLGHTPPAANQTVICYLDQGHRIWMADWGAVGACWLASAGFFLHSSLCCSSSFRRGSHGNEQHQRGFQVGGRREWRWRLWGWTPAPGWRHRDAAGTASPAAGATSTCRNNPQRWSDEAKVGKKQPEN